MKTSNKILLGLISVIGLSMLSILIFAKGSLINIEGGSLNGNGVIIQKTHQIDLISLFKIGGNYEVFIKKGAPNLMIETDENIQELFETQYNNNYYKGEKQVRVKELTIQKIGNVELLPTQGVKIYLTTPDLEYINVKDFTRVTFEDSFTSENFVVRTSDSAELNGKLDTKKLTITCSDFSRVNLAGSIEDAIVDTKDGAELSLKDINAKEVSVKQSGNSKISLQGASMNFSINAGGSSELTASNLIAEQIDIEGKNTSALNVSASKTLNVNLIDNASVVYSGNPEITKTLSNAATIRPLE